MSIMHHALQKYYADRHSNTWLPSHIQDINLEFQKSIQQTHFLASSFRVFMISALRVASSHSSLCEAHTVSRNTSVKMVAQTAQMLLCMAGGKNFLVSRVV